MTTYVDFDNKLIAGQVLPLTELLVATFRHRLDAFFVQRVADPRNLLVDDGFLTTKLVLFAKSSEALGYSTSLWLSTRRKKSEESKIYLADVTGKRWRLLPLGHLRYTEDFPVVVFDHPLP